MKNVNRRRQIFFSLFKLECGPQEIKAREDCLLYTFSANWNKHDKEFEKRLIHIKSDVFGAVAVVDAKTPYNEA